MPSGKWLDWKARAKAAAILASRSQLDFGGTDSASLSDFTAKMRCWMACSATPEFVTASRCDAAKARMEWMRYSYCASQCGTHVEAQSVVS
jgi:hypothetical protein